MEFVFYLMYPFIDNSQYKLIGSYKNVEYTILNSKEIKLSLNYIGMGVQSALKHNILLVDVTDMIDECGEYVDDCMCARVTAVLNLNLKKYLLDMQKHGAFVI